MEGCLRLGTETSCPCRARPAKNAAALPLPHTFFRGRAANGTPACGREKGADLRFRSPHNAMRPLLPTQTITLF